MRGNVLSRVEMGSSNAAANGRFFETKDEPPTTLRDHALTAYTALTKIVKARDTIETGDLCPDLISQQSLDEARTWPMDQGATWRREIDLIATNIARQFPNQILGDDFFDNDHEMHLSDGERLYKIDDQSRVWVFSDCPTQADLELGIQRATEDMWQELIFRITVS